MLPGTPQGSSKNTSQNGPSQPTGAHYPDQSGHPSEPAMPSKSPTKAIDKGSKLDAMKRRMIGK